MRKLLILLLTAAITIILDSCTSFLKTTYDVSDVKIEQMKNGYMVRFTANKRIDDVEAFISQSNWLMVTIVNASIDSLQIRSAKPVGIIQKIETENYGPSVQVSFKLSENSSKVEVVRDPASNDIFVNLITIPPN